MAQAAPLLGHLDPEFLTRMDAVQQDLRTVFGTQNPFTLPISGTGSAGMETCLANLVGCGDRVVVGIHGVRASTGVGRIGAIRNKKTPRWAKGDPSRREGCAGWRG